MTIFDDILKIVLEFLTLKPETFGLDISDLSLKIIKLKTPLFSKKKGLGLASFGEIEIKPGVIEGGEIRDEKALIEIIKNSLIKVRGEKLKTKYVIASLPEEKAFLQVIQLPIMKEEEVKKAAYFEAENYIPLPIEKVYLDSQIIPPVQDNLDHLDVLISALPKEIIDAYLSSLQKAGLKPVAFEIESQAISRALIEKGVSLEPLLLIDLGAIRTSFIIFSGYSLRLTSSRPISAQKFTETIAKELKIDLKEAEELKRKYGIENNKKGREILKILNPDLIDLVEEIKKYLEYYQTHSAHEHLPSNVNGKKIRKIYLCGGGANLKGLADFLALQLGLRVELGNPWINILPKPLKEVPELPYHESLRYTTALGLALRGIKP